MSVASNRGHKVRGPTAAGPRGLAGRGRSLCCFKKGGFQNSAVPVRMWRVILYLEEFVVVRLFLKKPEVSRVLGGFPFRNSA